MKVATKNSTEPRPHKDLSADGVSVTFLKQIFPDADIQPIFDLFFRDGTDLTRAKDSATMNRLIENQALLMTDGYPRYVYAGYVTQIDTQEMGWWYRNKNFANNLALLRMPYGFVMFDKITWSGNLLESKFFFLGFVVDRAGRG